MGAKHTQGEWIEVWDKYVIPAAHDGRRIGRSTNSKQHVSEFAHVIAHVEQDNSWFTPEQVTANARLIAAAPTMLDALEELMQQAVTSLDYRPEFRRAIAGASAAIAKATLD